jgi:hypothetical protein
MSVFYIRELTAQPEVNGQQPAPQPAAAAPAQQAAGEPQGEPTAGLLNAVQHCHILPSNGSSLSAGWPDPMLSAAASADMLTQCKLIVQRLRLWCSA